MPKLLRFQVHFVKFCLLCCRNDSEKSSLLEVWWRPKLAPNTGCMDKEREQPLVNKVLLGYITKYSNSKPLACDSANKHALTWTREIMRHAVSVIQLSDRTNGDDLYICIAKVNIYTGSTKLSDPGWGRTYNALVCVLLSQRIIAHDFSLDQT